MSHNTTYNLRSSTHDNHINFKATKTSDQQKHLDIQEQYTPQYKEITEYSIIYLTLH